MQRRFVKGLAAMTVGAVSAQLKEQYDNVPVEWKIAQLVSDANTEYGSLAEVAAKLGLKPKSTGVPVISSVEGSVQRPIPSLPTRVGSPLPQVPLRSSPQPTLSGRARTEVVPTTPEPGGTPLSGPTLRPPTKKATDEPATTPSPVTSEPQEGTLTVETPLTLNVPKDQAFVFKGTPPEYVTARMGGARYRIKAGQDYLNTALSATYRQDKAEIKGAKAQLKLPSLTKTGERDADVRVIGDGHHRFVWGAFHGDPVAAEQSNTPSPPVSWRDMKYKPPPEGIKLNPILDLGAIKEEIYRAWVSKEPIFVGYRRNGKAAFVKKMCSHKKLIWTEEAGAALVSYITDRDAVNPITEYDAVVDDLAVQGGTERARRYAAYLKAVAFKQKPPIIRGDAVTTGFVDTVRNVVTLDPKKNTTPEMMLDTLAFEAQNASQRDKLTEAKQKGGGDHTADVEYETDRKYVFDALMKVHRLSTLDELVGALGITVELRVPAEFATAFPAGKVDMPAKSVMPGQDMRQALWWWKTKDWPDVDRKKMWKKESHGEGLGSSTAIYGK